jgi:CMP-N-acetylneuraminic acid synthetase/sialic acid synthase SpsE
VNVLVLIPARAGSKGLPGKNLRRLAGISLVGHAVRVGRRFLQRSAQAGSVLIDTDSEAIAEEAVRWGADAPFLRPSVLAADDTKTIDSVLHALDRLEAAGRHHDGLVLLQPTSPLRTTDDVSACMAAYDPALGSSLSVVQIEHPSEQSLELATDGTIAWSWPELKPDRRRQEFPAAWRPSGSVYVSSVESLRTHRAFLVPGCTRGVPIPAARSIDIDRVEDLELAEALARSGDLPGLRIGKREVGRGARCFVIANVVLSEGRAARKDRVASIARAIDLAADAAADAVSFTASDPRAALDLGAAAFAKLLGYARSRGVDLLCCPVDPAHADALDALGVTAFRAGPALRERAELLGHLAGKGKPLLIDTGGADVVDLDDAIAEITALPGAELALVDPRLRTRLDLQTALGVLVGFADRQPGVGPAVAAVAQGAAIVDKTLASDGSRPNELRELVHAIRAAEAELGPSVAPPRPRAPT